MGASVLEKVKKLPPENQQEVEDFVDYLLYRYQEAIGDSDIAEKRKSNIGWAKNKIWIADDFNETPEDFKDYI